MRSIKRVFTNIQKKNPNYSSFQCLVETVVNKSYARRTISYWFNILVEKDDYRKKEKKKLLSFLYDLSNTSEDCTK